MKKIKILEDYLNYASINKSTSTINEYRYDLIKFLEYLKGNSHIDMKFIRQIKLNDIYTYLAYLKNVRGDSAATIARKTASIKSFFKYLYSKAKLIEENPAKELESPKLGKRLPKYLTLEQSTILLDKVKHKKITGKMHDNRIRDYAMITLFLNCGMRLSELIGINIDHVKFDKALLTVIGKGNKERTVYLNTACTKAIKEYLKVRPFMINEKALFLSERKQRISKRAVQQIIKDYLMEVPGLDMTFSTHKLRHTAATLMYQYGNVDIRTLQELLGHESIQTTEIYVHVNNEQIRLAVESNPLANYR